MSKNIKLQGLAPEFNISTTTPGGSVEFILGGNLTVQGTTTTIESETLSVADNMVVLNSDIVGAPTEDAGIEIERGTDLNTRIQWNETTDKWEVTEDGSTYYNIYHEGMGDFASKPEDELITGRWTFNETSNITPSLDTIVNIDGTTTSSLDLQLGGFTRIAHALTATDFELRRHNGAGALLDSPIKISLADGSITLDTPLVHAPDDLPLEIAAGDMTVLNQDGRNLTLRGGAGNGTGVEGKIILGGPTDSTRLETPSSLEVTSTGTMTMSPSGDMIIKGLTYPAADGIDGQVLTTDGFGNLVFESTSLATLPDGNEGDIIVFRTSEWVYEQPPPTDLIADLTPQLGGDLDVNGFAITSASSGDVVITPDGTGIIEVGDTIKAVDQSTLLVSAGDDPAATGEDLTITGGAGLAGDDGIVLLGQPTSDATLKATNGDMNLEVAPAQKVNIGDPLASVGQISGPDESDLQVTGGESFGVADGGDLILSGGASAGGQPGQVIIVGGLLLPEPPIAVYPINFFVPDLITTGANPNIVLDGVGITDDATIQPSGHIGYCTVPPTNVPSPTYEYVLRRVRGLVETQIGTVEFSDGIKTATDFTITDDALLAGDIVQLVNPAAPSAVIENITITLRAITL
jgi:hypothetical protein